jgi:hypothetical protein
MVETMRLAIRIETTIWFHVALWFAQFLIFIGADLDEERAAKYLVRHVRLKVESE